MPDQIIDENPYKRFVDYDKLDPFKRKAVEVFSQTLNNLLKHGAEPVIESLGETAQVIRRKGQLFAFNVEGLGNKSAIAEEMARRDWPNRGRYFAGIGQDCALMSLNDLLAVGAQALLYAPIIAVNNGDYFNDDVINEAILQGFLHAVNDAGAAILGGETPALKFVIKEGASDFAGASFGVIDRDSDFCHGGRVRPGHNLFGLASSGVHANGISTPVDLASRLKHGYFTELPSGRTFGEALLTPTLSYSGVVHEVLGQTEIAYMAPITGHGLKKISRPRKPMTYVIEHMPALGDEFTFIKERKKFTNEAFLETYNCGVGWVFYAEDRAWPVIEQAAKDHGIMAFKLGYVEKGPKRVLIQPYKVRFTAKDL